jgi:hypothetical protein
MAIVKSGAGTDMLTVNPTSKSNRVTFYNSGGSESGYGGLATFSASNSFTPAATPNDLVTISGSITKLVKIISFTIATNNTAAGSQKFYLVKRNSLNIGGTFTATKATGHSSDGAQSTVSVGHYTVDQTTVGNPLGTINVVFAASQNNTPTTWSGFIDGNDPTNRVELLPRINSQLKPVILRGKEELLCLNFNNAALVSGQNHVYRIVWTEE